MKQRQYNLDKTAYDLEKEKQEAIRQVERVMDQLQAIDVEVNE